MYHNPSWHRECCRRFITVCCVDQLTRQCDYNNEMRRHVFKFKNTSNDTRRCLGIYPYVIKVCKCVWNDKHQINVIGLGGSCRRRVSVSNVLFLELSVGYTAVVFLFVPFSMSSMW